MRAPTLLIAGGARFIGSNFVLSTLRERRHRVVNLDKPTYAANLDNLTSDRFNVFEVLIPGALGPGQELVDCAVIGGSCVSVADRDRKKLEELFPG
jgi:nucleoside-diphosphate-sugar epimerase